jgi:ATP-binding protein involved in chromosome partitioning
MTRTPIPQRIHRGERKIVIFWSDDHEGSYRARDLRLNCQCANCVDEMTRTPLLDPASVPPDVSAVAISLVGNYAIKIDWSDGHNTGIYTYERLWEMCGCEKCRSEKGE